MNSATKILFLLLILTVAPNFSFCQTEEEKKQIAELKKEITEGIALHDKGEYQKAIEKYNDLLKLYPDLSVVNYEIALSYSLIGDYENAEKYSKKVIDLNEGSILEAYILYGSVLDEQGRVEKSIEVYEEAMSKFDDYLLNYNYAVA